jgi:hypothetical protein
MTRRMLAVLVAALAAALGASLADGDGTAQTREPGCKGHVATIDMPRAKYPAIVDHIEDSWAKGYPVVLRVNRDGAKRRRDRLLGWWQRRHPQPKGDHMDLDEAPATALRSDWRADVRPIDEHENRGAGAKLGAELRGLRDGTCVRYAFGGR